jgi:hypothetical protein
MYYGLGAVILGILAIVVWQSFFSVAPTCFDNTQNGTEVGVDCGGSCALLCKDNSHNAISLWARTFQTSDTTYTAAAYIQNGNVGAGAKKVQYSFQLFDADNQLVVEKDGVVDLPPIQTIPIIEPNIHVGNRVVTHAQFAFSVAPVFSKVPAGTIVPLRITQQKLSADASQLSATLVNDTLNDAKAVAVAAVLFDNNGVAQAASKSFFTKVPKKGSQDVVFTWPSGVPNIVRAEITVLPSF